MACWFGKMRRGWCWTDKKCWFFVPNVFLKLARKKVEVLKMPGWFSTKVKPKFGGIFCYWRNFSTSKTRYCSLSHSFNFPLSFCTSQAMLARFLNQQWFLWKPRIANKKKDPQLWQSADGHNSGEGLRCHWNSDILFDLRGCGSGWRCIFIKWLLLFP